jgi:hypothetical protein
VHWANGGETKLVNLVLLCSHHHRLLHEGGYAVKSVADHLFVFSDRAGRPLPESPQSPPAGGPSLAQRNEGLGAGITPDSCRSLGGGEPYDLGLAIEALIAAPGNPLGATERCVA